MSRLTVDTTGLLRRLGAGCDRARSDLIAHSCDRLRRVARRMLGEDFSRLRRWEQTDDVLQNSLLRLNRALAACAPESSAHFWNLAARLIRRELTDLARHHFGPEGHAAKHHTDRSKGYGPSEQVARPSSNGGEPSSPVEWAVFLAMAEKLPVKEREVFDLLWVQEMTQEKIATVLNVSLRTVKRRWLSARLRLAQALRGAGLGEGGSHDGGRTTR